MNITICPTACTDDPEVYKRQIEQTVTYAHRVHIDLSDGVFTPNKLTAIEFAMLRGLMVKPMHVLNRTDLMRASHAGNIHVADRTIDSHIRNIRAKLAALACDNVIETIHGVGFKLGRCEKEA